MSIAAGFNQRHPRGVVVTRAVVAVWLLVLAALLLAYGLWGVALFTFVAAIAHVVLAYRVYRSIPR